MTFMPCVSDTTIKLFVIFIYKRLYSRKTVLMKTFIHSIKSRKMNTDH